MQEAGVPQRVTRLAPSPTGALHLGNARTFLINWAMARRSGWRVLLRVEDLDGPRVKAGADRGAIEDLRWLGMDWDEGPVYQATDLGPYQAALDRLLAQRLIYPCPASRKEIEASLSAPHRGDHEVWYPGIHRPRSDAEWARVAEMAADRGLLSEDAWAWRVVIPDEEVEVVDGFAESVRVDVQAAVGDFVVASKAGLPAYQLAVVVDDARQGVTDVVRGDDLLEATARQRWLYRFLGWEDRLPDYVHVPLVVGEDGRRLAKRHGDTRVAFFRERGVSAERVIGLVAWWSGFLDEREVMSAEEFAGGFALDRLPRGAVTCTQEDVAWLLDGC
ncbi:MAG: tRNA glutamyl-Q(34) synthetase GluQRS [Phycisphaeraceae bacterium]